MRLVVWFATVSLLVAAGAGSASSRAGNWEQQLAFGAQMAGRGLWAEALFRFERANQLNPNHARTLSNLGVSSEALGRFDDALGYYRRALELRPNDREIRGNYDRFLGFYEAYQARRDEAAAPNDDAVVPDPPEPTASAAPPESAPPGAAPDAADADAPQVAPEAKPTPPNPDDTEEGRQ